MHSVSGLRIIISPAKKMNVNTDLFPIRHLPAFLEDAEKLLACLRGMTYGEARSVWKCNDAIASLNYERVRDMDLRRGLTPAILAYEGIQYQYMAPGVFTDEAYEYIEEHLRILSGFYGILRPFDGVTPYRLEMQARLGTEKVDSLYRFWGSRLADRLFDETDYILNLASKEYSRCIKDFLRPEIRFITCVFGELTGGRVKEKGTLCKMARGEMVRYMAEKHITAPEEIRNFDRLHFAYREDLSDENTFVFIKEEEEQC